MELFPLGAGISELRGIIKLTKDNGNAIEISRLATETRKGIDVLLPLIDACRILGLCTVKGGSMKLTASGLRLTAGNMRAILSKRLADIEPFKRSFAVIGSHKRLTTVRLSELLGRDGIILYSEKATNVELLKGLLLKWAVRLNLSSYNPKTDEWSLVEG
jgi:hypothetical protein